MHSTWVKKYIRGRQQYGECNTSLRELAATEMVKCVHYMIIIALVWSCRVVSKFHYTDPKTLSATRPDPRTKSVHVEIE